MKPAGPTHPVDAPPQRKRPLKVLGGIVADVDAGGARDAEPPLHQAEGARMRLCVTRPPAAGDHDLAGELVEPERPHLRALGVKPAVGDDGDLDAVGRTFEELLRVRTEPKPRRVRPVALQQRSDDPRLGSHAPLRQDAVEDEGSLPGDEPAPRGLEEPAQPELAPDESVDRPESAAHVVALEVERIVQVEHHEPLHSGSIRSGATCRPITSMS